MKVIRSLLTGYCHGVDSTIKKAKEVVKTGCECGLPFYSIGALIHNNDAVKYFNDAGMAVIEKPDGFKPGIALVRAHGITDTLRLSFLENGFRIVDATCYNIEKTRNAILKAFNERRSIVIVGVKNHAEIRCLTGILKDGHNIECTVISSCEDAVLFVKNNNSNLPVTCVVQTTFSEDLYNDIVSVLSSHFTDFATASCICRECIMRKKYAAELVSCTDAVVVVGGSESENTKQLANSISALGKKVFLIENAESIDSHIRNELSCFSCIGLCSGTSTPDFVIDSVQTYLESL